MEGREIFNRTETFAVKIFWPAFQKTTDWLQKEWTPLGEDLLEVKLKFIFRFAQYPNLIFKAPYCYKYFMCKWKTKNLIRIQLFFLTNARSQHRQWMRGNNQHFIIQLCLKLWLNVNWNYLMPSENFKIFVDQII